MILNQWKLQKTKNLIPECTAGEIMNMPGLKDLDPKRKISMQLKLKELDQKTKTDKGKQKLLND